MVTKPALAKNTHLYLDFTVHKRIVYIETFVYSIFLIYFLQKGIEFQLFLPSFLSFSSLSLFLQLRVVFVAVSVTLKAKEMSSRKCTLQKNPFVYFLV